MPDSVGESVGTAGAIGVGTVVTGAIETIGDQDWYRVTLNAGQRYFINLTGDKHTTETDWAAYPSIRILDANGQQIVESADRNFRDSAFIDFTAPTSGDYYISAEDAAKGGYVLTLDTDIPDSAATASYLQEVFTFTGYVRADPGYDENWYRVEVPNYYSEEEALLIEVTDAKLGNKLGNACLQLFDENGHVVADGVNRLSLAMMDAGTYYVAVSGTSPSASGYYDVGYAVFGYEQWSTPLRSLDYPYTFPSNGQTAVIDVFLGEGGVRADDGEGDFTSRKWSPEERAAVAAAFAEFERVADVHFNLVSNIADADFAMLKNNNEPDTGLDDDAPGDILGYWWIGGTDLEYGGTSYDLKGVGVFNSKHESWAPEYLKPGGYGYITLIHELGHSLGLKHPHDADRGEHMAGVEDEADLGNFSLNQGIYTTMGYNDGWVEQPGVNGSSPYDRGWQSGLMALDIAMLQRIYGKTAYADGDTSYKLPGGTHAGTSFQSIWDTGGVDTIRYGGSKDAVISLQAATLEYSADGGGVVSYVKGVRGGFTIANGVWIENATSGSGDDWLQGNLRANTLDGGAGRDTADYSNRHRPIEVTLARSAAAGVTIGGKAEDIILNIENFVGGAAGDTLTGDGARNWLTGGGGHDLLRGKGGSDRFVFSSKLGTGNADTIADFKHNTDVLALDDKIFKAVGSVLTSGEFYAKAGAHKGHDKDDRLVYDKTTGDLYYDKDGKGGAAAVLLATLSNHPTSLDHSDFLIV